MRIAALQLDVRCGEVDANVARVEAGLRAAAERGVELVALPEMWPTSFAEPGAETDWWPPTAAALERIAALSRELGLVVCGSSFARDARAPETGAPGSRERLRNRLTVFDRGELVLSYDKVHLFGLTGEEELFSAGDAPPPTVRVRGLLLSGVVCYDLRFAPLLRAPYLAEADLLVVPAQWPSTRAGQWRALAVARAIEAQCFVLAANRTGVAASTARHPELRFPGNSLIVGPGGDVLAEGCGEEGLVVAEIDLAEVAKLRRELPLRRDQRADVYARVESSI